MIKFPKFLKSLLTIVSILVISSIVTIPIMAEQTKTMTHTVQAGDTLWDICEFYYGDFDLWPKLWQMNPFVTNPHLLTAGDIILLFKGKPIIKREGTKPPVKISGPEKPIQGINIEGLTNVKSLGFLSLTNIKPWGHIFTSESGSIMLSKGDMIFVVFDRTKEVSINDEFSILRSSPLLKHPVTGKNLGYSFSINGRMVIVKATGLTYTKDKEKHQKSNVFQAKIVDLYHPIYQNDIVLPYEPISSCILPVSTENEDFLGNIVAAKDQQKILGQNSIVYLEKGFDDGIRRGNLFEVVKTNIVKDPDPDTQGKKTFFHKPKLILPDIQIGTIMIVESRPDTSTAIVLSSEQDFSTGMYIKPILWTNNQNLLSYISDCPVE